MRKRPIMVSILLTSSICVVCWYLSNERLDIYTITNNGHSIIKDNKEYVFNRISDDKVRGKAIGKAVYNSEKFYVFEEKGKDSHNYIIVMGVDIGVNEEYIDKTITTSNK